MKGMAMEKKREKERRNYRKHKKDGNMSLTALKRVMTRKKCKEERGMKWEAMKRKKENSGLEGREEEISGEKEMG